ncbi:MAG: aspartate aminotransferase family protein [Planctomycetota bacterium]|jgi:acetylornithine/N-succinyldiaminopimelate aminotransferase|nr:aspartate aminotransferase family protein [Planctomycetota bacterium]
MNEVPNFELGTIPADPHLVQNYGRWPIRFVRGEGSWLIDDRDRRFLDCLSGIAVNALGHGHPGLIQAIRDQAGKLLHTSNLFHIGPQEQLARQICEASFAERVYFCNSGAEANESALKLVRLWGNVVHEGRKGRIIAAEHSFHGRTIGALSLTGNPAYHAGFEPLLPVEFVPYGDPEALAQAMGPDVAGVFLEPLQGEGGVIVPPPGYLAKARELCDRNEALLVFDEVQVGCGRTGRLFAYQQDNVVPDIMTLAKALGGGVPIGALCTTSELSALLRPGTHASTFGGNHLACAAGCAVMRELTKPGLLAEVRHNGEWMIEQLGSLFGAKATAVRGRGMLLGVRMAEDGANRVLATAALNHGLVVGTAGDNVLRIAPPLTITRGELGDCLARLEAALG